MRLGDRLHAAVGGDSHLNVQRSTLSLKLEQYKHKHRQLDKDQMDAVCRASEDIAYCTVRINQVAHIMQDQGLRLLAGVIQ